jgi:hypothetical protein
LRPVLLDQADADHADKEQDHKFWGLEKHGSGSPASR